MASVLLDEVAISPTTEPQGGQSQIGEQLYQRSSGTTAKVLGPTTDLPTWRSNKGTENPSEFDFEGERDFITKCPQDWGNRDSWRAQTKYCVQWGQGERSSDHIRD